MATQRLDRTVRPGRHGSYEIHILRGRLKSSSLSNKIFYLARSSLESGKFTSVRQSLSIIDKSISILFLLPSTHAVSSAFFPRPSALSVNCALCERDIFH